MRFSIEDYKERACRLEWDDLDLTRAFAAKPLDEDSLRCIRYMHDVEFHTICYLRDLLLTPAHADPEITTFLTFWAFEEYWHGEALSHVLAAHGEANGAARVATVRTRPSGGKLHDPIVTAVAGAWFGDDFSAVHMTWGAINEWTTQAGYAQLGRRASHPTLSALLQRIMRQEGRHIDFYASQARERLTRSRRAQRLTKFALRRFWHPVGTGVMPAEETDFLARHLFGDVGGLDAARRIDRRIDGLAGLSGLHLLEGARDDAMGRLDPVPSVSPMRVRTPLAA